MPARVVVRCMENEGWTLGRVLSVCIPWIPISSAAFFVSVSVSVSVLASEGGVRIDKLVIVCACAYGVFVDDDDIQDLSNFTALPGVRAARLPLLSL